MNGFYINIQTPELEMVVTQILQDLHSGYNLRGLPLMEPSIDVKNRGDLPFIYLTRDDALEVVGAIKFLKFNNIIQHHINNITIEQITY